MGLDSYFKVKTGEQYSDLVPDARLVSVKLCGGLMSSNGNDGSFRGKVYAEFLNVITGDNFSLYREEQGVESYNAVPPAIQSWLKENPDSDRNIYGVSRQEIEDLKTLFEVAAEQNAVLIGWW